MMGLINPHVFCLHQQRSGCGAEGCVLGVQSRTRLPASPPPGALMQSRTRLPASPPPRRLVPRGEQTEGRWITASISPCVWLWGPF